MSEISLTGDQMLFVLEAVAQKSPISVADLARDCQISRTVAHRLLATLMKHSFVQRRERGYSLGPALARLGRLSETSVQQVAEPFMDRLSQQTGETVVLHGVDGLDAVVLHQAVGTGHMVRVEHTPGLRHPLYKGASGWALLAFQSEKTIQRVREVIGADQQFIDRISAVVSDRYALSHDELQMGVHGIAAPIIGPDGHCQASIAILVPSSRAQSILGYLDALQDTATVITARLGAR